MLTHHKTGWRYTTALMITIEAGFLHDPEGTPGLMHVAEHMMFSGTKKYNREQLRERFVHLKELEAQTSRNKVKIFCYFDHVDFDLAVDTLHQMVFNWHCRTDVFLSETKDLIEETRRYKASFSKKRFDAIARLLPELGEDGIGEVTQWKTFKYTDVKKAKAHWQKLIHAVPRHVFVLSNAITSSQLAKLERLFSADPHPVFESEWQPMNAKFSTDRHVAVFSYSSAAPHLNDLLLYNVFVQRWWDYNPGADFSSHWFDGIYAFDVFLEKGSISSKSAQALFLKPVTKQEFVYEKNLFLAHWHKQLDAIDPIEALHWFEGFAQPNRYAPLFTSDPMKNYQYFKNLSWKEFKKTCDRIQKSV